MNSQIELIRAPVYLAQTSTHQNVLKKWSSDQARVNSVNSKDLEGDRVEI